MRGFQCRFSFRYYAENLDRQIKSFNVFQHVEQPTRITNTSSTLVDLFISRRTNNSALFSLSITPPFASDHCGIHVVHNRHRREHAILRTQYSYHITDFEALIYDIQSNNWDFVFNPHPNTPFTQTSPLIILQ